MIPSAKKYEPPCWRAAKQEAEMPRLTHIIAAFTLALLVMVGTARAQCPSHRPPLGCQESLCRNTGKLLCRQLFPTNPSASSIALGPAYSCVEACRGTLGGCLAPISPVPGEVCSAFSGCGKCQRACVLADRSADAACTRGNNIPCHQANDLEALRCNAACVRDTASAFSQCNQAYLDCLQTCAVQ
jgi:hypothetical protein